MGIILRNVPGWHRRAVSSVLSPSSTLPSKGRVGGSYFYPPVKGRVFRRTLAPGTSSVIISAVSTSVPALPCERIYRAP